MNIKAFFVTALTSALENSVGSPEDILKHVTPELLAAHLPRPLWARLLTAALGASRLDATLVVETVGIANLCEHIPSHVIWAVVYDLGQRSLGGEVPAYRPRVGPFIPAATPAPVPLAAPPPEVVTQSKPAPPPPPPGPSIPAAPEAFGDLERDEKTQAASSGQQPSRARTPTGQGRFRSSATGIGRLAQATPATPPPPSTGARRPQAVATEPNPTLRPARRGSTEVSDYDVETNVGQEEWKNALAVDDEQLVDWSSSEETQAGDLDKPKR